MSAPRRRLPSLAGLLLLSVLTTALTTAAPSGAQPSPAREEARVHFQRGRAAFDAGDNATALAELEAAQRLAPNPVVLYNIALVHAAALRPVEAVETSDRLLAAPAGLSSPQLDRLHTMRAEQALRIGGVRIVCVVPPGTKGSVEVDGVEVATVAPELTLRLSTGRHVVGIVTTEHVPLRREILVASGEPQALTLEPIRREGRLASLSVSSSTRDADILVDGELVGRTPLPAPLAVSAGKHDVRLQRPGYLPSERSLVVGEGVRADLAFSLEEDPASLATLSGSLRVRASEPHAQIFVDDVVRRTSGEIRLPEGSHTVRVEREGFRPHTRSLTLARGGTLDVVVQLEPTAEYLDAYKTRTGTVRTVGIVGVVAGSLALGGGAAFLVYNHGKKETASAARDRAFEEPAKKNGICAESSAEFKAEACAALLENADYEQRIVARRDVYGWVGVGIGAAVVGTGAGLLFFGSSPSRYDRPATASPYAGLPSLRFGVSPLGGATVSGAF